jgi:hypothetical protein
VDLSEEDEVVPNPSFHGSHKHEENPQNSEERKKQRRDV